MAKSKDPTAVTKPRKASTKPIAKKAPHKVNLSQELVGESDDEDQVAKPKAAPIKENGTKIAQRTNGTSTKLSSKSEVTESSTSDESGEDNSEDDSEESEDSDDTESSHAQPMPKKSNTIPAKVNGVKRKAQEQSSSENVSSDDSSSDQNSKPRAKKTKKADSSPEEQSAHSDEAGLTSTAIASKSTPSSAPTPIPAGKFNPPSGYTPLQKSTSSPTFTPSSLNGKQIWHITAPSNLPLTSLTTLAAESLQTGATVLTHKGTSYTLRSDDNPLPAPLHLFLPSAKFLHTYEPVSQAVSRTLHLQPKLTLPALPHSQQTDRLSGSAAAAAIAMPAVSTVRPQPRGLRMRYRPPGFGGGDPGRIGSGSDEDEGEDRDGEGERGSGLQFPAVAGASGGPAAIGTKHAEGKKEKKDKKKERKGERQEKTEKKEEKRDAERSKEEKRAEKEAKRARKEAKKMATKVMDAATS